MLGAVTVDGDVSAPYLKGIQDPISTGCVLDLGNAQYGMSQRGAIRWAKGQTCPEGTNANWPVKWDYKQILAHYYTGVEFKNDNTGVSFAPDDRWNLLWHNNFNSPIDITPVLIGGQSTPLQIRLQNTSTTAWAANTIEVGYNWGDGNWQVATLGEGQSFPDILAGKEFPDLAPQQQPPLTINVIPPATSGTAILHLDLRRSGGVWFSQQLIPWPDAEIAVNVTPSITCGLDNLGGTCQQINSTTIGGSYQWSGDMENWYNNQGNYARFNMAPVSRMTTVFVTWWESTVGMISSYGVDRHYDVHNAINRSGAILEKIADNVFLPGNGSSSYSQPGPKYYTLTIETGDGLYLFNGANRSGALGSYEGHGIFTIYVSTTGFYEPPTPTPTSTPSPIITPTPDCTCPSCITVGDLDIELLPLLYRVRDEILSQTSMGQHYTDLYYENSPEIVQILLSNPDLKNEAYSTLQIWKPYLQALADGQGDTVTITAGQVQAMQNFLDHLSAQASPSLQQTVANERAHRPLENAVGMTMEEAEDYLFDTTPPTVVGIVRENADPTNAASVNFVVTFSEPVTGVDVGDFGLTVSGISGASIAGINGSGNAYVVSVSTGNGSGALRLDVIANGTIKDISTNPLTVGFSGGETYTIDKTPPIVLSIARVSASPTNAVTINYTVTFSESVTGVNTTDFNLTTSGVSGAFVFSVSGSGNSYTVAVRTGSGDGTIRLNVIANGTIADSASNPLSSGFTVGETYDMDKTPPAVLSVVRASANPTTAAHVTFTVTLSEPVARNVFPACHLQLTTTGSISSAKITGFSGSDAVYTIVINTGIGVGTIRLDVIGSEEGVYNPYPIWDLAGNFLFGIFSNGQSYNVTRSTLLNEQTLPCPY